ncbi:MAG: hypothetical protein ABJA66_15665 [Actinomycetota bacterium]
MKKCQKCNFQNEALIDFCWQCGSQLANVSNAGNYYQSAPPTQEFRSETPTYYRGNQTQDFSVYQNNYAPKHQTSVKPTNYGRIAIVLGSIFIFLLMVSGAGAAVAYKIFYRPLIKPCCREEQYKNPEPVKPEPVKQTEPVKVAPSPKPVTTEKASVSGEKIWVDYGVTENGRLGMRIHVKFSVKNMKNEDSFLAIYFEKSNGTSLKTTNKKFAAKDGTVAVYRSMKPGYDEADYKDFDVFMPYDELNLGRGKYDLKMDADVIMENGDFVGHLDYHEFTYERK